MLRSFLMAQWFNDTAVVSAVGHVIGVVVV